MEKNTRTILQPLLRPGCLGDAEMPRLPGRGEKWRLFAEAVGSLGGVLLLGVFSSYCAPLIRGLEGGLSGWVLWWMLSPRPPEKPSQQHHRVGCDPRRLVSPGQVSVQPVRACWVTGGRNLSQFQVSGPVSPKGALCSTIYTLRHTFGLVWVHNEAACTG